VETEKNSKPAKRALRLMAANEPAKSFHSPLAKGQSRDHNQEKSTSSPAGITRPSVVGSNAPRDTLPERGTAKHVVTVLREIGIWQASVVSNRYFEPFLEIYLTYDCESILPNRVVKNPWSTTVGTKAS
jgi:hypothetical protein